MQIEVVGRHMALGDDQVVHATAEADRLGKFFDGINGIKITFEHEHDDMKAEIVCQVSGGRTLVAVEHGRTVHESLEFASDNMARQIKKHKGKLHDHRAGRPQPKEPEEEAADEDVGAEEEE